MIAADAARPKSVTLRNPTPKQMEQLHAALFYLGHDLQTWLDQLTRPDPHLEGIAQMTESFATLANLVVEIEFAQRRGRRDSSADRPAEKKTAAAPPADPSLLLPFLGVVNAGGKSAEQTPARRPRRRFDFATLPPRVEAGC